MKKLLLVMVVRSCSRFLWYSTASSMIKLS